MKISFVKRRSCLIFLNLRKVQRKAKGTPKEIQEVKMDKEQLLCTLEIKLKDIVNSAIFLDQEGESLEKLFRDAEAFVRDRLTEYSVGELMETFSSDFNLAALFMEYRDAIQILGEDDEEPSPGASLPAAPVMRPWREPNTGIEFVWVPEGSFMMGDADGLIDEQPVHKVHLDGFWMAKFAVTVAQYIVFAKEVGGHFPQWMEKGSPFDIVNGTDDHYKRLGHALLHEAYPIVGVSWHDAVAYAQWLSEKAGRKFNLPTEAQWEYAARSGGQEEKYAGGYPIDKVCWYYENSGDLPHPVGTKLPNGLGLYNMCGNVCEWCLDTYNRFAYEKHEKKNPLYLGDRSSRVVRGGSYNYGAQDIRCTDRSLYVPEVRENHLGFRLVMLEGMDL